MLFRRTLGWGFRAWQVWGWNVWRTLVLSLVFWLLIVELCGGLITLPIKDFWGVKARLAGGFVC